MVYNNFVAIWMKVYNTWLTKINFEKLNIPIKAT